MMLFCRSLLFLSALIVVEAQVATSPPTEAPTFAPTVEGTSPPTVAPTVEGTSPPTVAPTSSPTSAPTSSPTSQPTSNPTSQPTSEPTLAPTFVPTSEPTFLPTATRTESPSDFPSDVPSDIPSSVPSTDESEMPSTIPSVINQECMADTCKNYPTTADLKAAVAKRSNVCMCAGTLVCTGTSEDTITIESDQKVEIECAESECRLECRNAAFIVKGDLFLKGNDIMTLTGGVSESRISVEAGGTLSMEKVNVVDTSAVFQRRRDLSESRQLSVGSGNGAGVYNAGKMTASECNFYNCKAELLGGAIWTNDEAVVQNCEFKGNQAAYGGAIYVASGEASLTGNVFEDNSASENEDYDNIFVGNTATVDGCNNPGLEGELGATCSSSTAARVALVLSVFVGSLSFVMAL